MSLERTEQDQEQEQSANEEGGALRGAQTVYRAISILEAFKADHAVLTLAEICEAVELTPPTAHRLLRALRSHDLISFDERARTYSLGTGVMRLASVLLNRDDVLSIVAPRLHRLRDVSGETVSLHWRVADHRVCLMENVSSQQIRMASGLGNAYPLVAGAAGKAILAYLPWEDVEQVMEMERRNGRTFSAAVLKADLEEVPQPRLRAKCRRDGPFGRCRRRARPELSGTGDWLAERDRASRSA